MADSGTLFALAQELDDCKRKRFRRTLLVCWSCLIGIPLATYVNLMLFADLDDDGWLIVHLMYALGSPVAVYPLWKLVHATLLVSERHASAVREGHYVLFLRPFHLDLVTAYERLPVGGAGGGLPGMVLPALFSPENVEKALTREIEAQVGLLISFGDPDAYFPEVGRKFYPPHDRWKADVEQLAASARCVLMHAGEAPGYVWELRMLRRVVKPERVFALTGFEGHEENFWHHTVSALLSADIRVPLNLNFPGPGSIIGFHRDWSPYVLRKELPSTRALIGVIHKVTSQASEASTGLAEEVDAPVTHVGSERVGVRQSDCAETCLLEQEKRKEEIRRWRNSVAGGVFSAPPAGCLLILSSIAALIFACIVIYGVVLSDGELFGVRIDSGRNLAQLLAIPAVLVGVAAFYLLSPFFYWLHKRWNR